MSTTTAIRRGLTENQDKVLTRQPTKDKGTARQRPHKGRRHPKCCRCQPGKTRLGLHHRPTPFSMWAPLYQRPHRPTSVCLHVERSTQVFTVLPTAATPTTSAKPASLPLPAPLARVPASSRHRSLAARSSHHRTFRQEQSQAESQALPPYYPRSPVAGGQRGSRISHSPPATATGWCPSVSTSQPPMTTWTLRQQA